MHSTAEKVSYCLEQFRQSDSKSAFFGLIESDKSVIPELISIFRTEQDDKVREFIVEVVWQHRDPSVISFLGEALQDHSAAVWQQAIDGLVTLASSAALTQLQTARTRRFVLEADAEDFRSWIDEAIEQIESNS